VSEVSDKPTKLPVPSSFSHSAMGLSPRLKFCTKSDGESHALCIDVMKTRVALVWATLVLLTLLAVLACFGFVMVGRGTWATVGLAVVSALIVPFWLFTFVPPILATRRVAKRTPVWCEFKGTTCVQIAGEPLNEPVRRVLHVLCRYGRGSTSQWQVQLASGQYRLLYQDESNVFGNEQINAWSRSAGFVVQSVEIKA
jgi:hypothetical protein